MSLLSALPSPTLVDASWFELLSDEDRSAATASSFSWRLHAERISLVWGLDEALCAIRLQDPWQSLCRMPGGRLAGLAADVLGWASAGTAAIDGGQVPLARILSSESIASLERLAGHQSAVLHLLACASIVEGAAPLLALRFPRRLWADVLPQVGDGLPAADRRLGCRLIALIVGAAVAAASSESLFEGAA
jgi:hypothetical protein